VDTLPLLRARIERGWHAAAELRADFRELDAGLATLAAAFDAGEIAYESLLLTKSECA
ncbi:MAG: hypothetical protein JNK15_04770, partial [Planctomycetes bacterium]|nr:hypothetical protein [Planctomycetota bacterium]